VKKMAEEAPAFLCFCCGVCCSKYQVQMTINEAHNIADRLGLSWEEMEAEYIDHSWPGVRTVLLRQRGGQCVFLDRQTDARIAFCRIQPFKPTSCIEWNADLDKKDCREGLAQYWKLNVDAEGKIEGAAGDIEGFNALLSRLGV
jgi:hypothetical protein